MGVLGIAELGLASAAQLAVITTVGAGIGTVAANAADKEGGAVVIS